MEGGKAAGGRGHCDTAVSMTNSPVFPSLPVGARPAGEAGRA